MVIDAKVALSEFGPKINKIIHAYIEKEARRSKNVSPNIEELIKNVDKISEGGKRLRGALLYYSYIMHGGKNREEALKAAAFIELIHTYLLVLDDIQDKASLRRGVPTLHYMYAAIHEKRFEKKEPRHFGLSMGLNASTFIASLGMQILSNLKFSPDIKIRVFNKITEILIDTAYGQTLDVFGEVLNSVDEDYILKVHQYKTGIYTYESPLHIGAMLAGANEADLKALTKFAIPAGIAFQIQDDILGMFGDEKKLGKPADSDLKEGKNTLLISKALEKSSAKDKEIVLRALGNPRIKERTLNEVRKIIVKTGSLDYSKNMATKLVKKAKKTLEEIKWNGEGKAFMVGISEYMINREV